MEQRFRRRQFRNHLEDFPRPDHSLGLFGWYAGSSEQLAKWGTANKGPDGDELQFEVGISPEPFN